MRSWAMACLCSSALLPSLTGPLAAQISPGPLAHPHGELEGSRHCARCHDPEKGIDPQACLDCHRPLAQRIASSEGLHAAPRYASCERCHVEHHGRDFELVYWGEAGLAGFDHGDTGEVLEGAHARLDCRACHRPENLADAEALIAAGKNLKRTFLGLSPDCLSCHEDPHRGQFEARSCRSCHDLEAWRPTPGFDHARTTYPLTGRHRTAPCASCHPAADPSSSPTFVRYRATPTACKDCHRDPHRGSLSTDCSRCHDTASFTAVADGAFDHDQTRYPLRRAHRRLACERCHRGTERRALVFSRCGDCHRDVHQVGFRADSRSRDCDSCHDLDGFRPARFDLDEHARSRYPLDGGHLAVPCTACHVPVRPRIRPRSAFLAPHGNAVARRYRWSELLCATCHEDPHEGRLRSYEGPQGCKACHATEGWSQVAFEHDRSRFPLRGAHGRLACASCHRVPSADRRGELRLSGLGLACQDCHADPHRGQFVTAQGLRPCSSCHDESSWRASAFDHGRDSRFSLDGAHDRLACTACHPREGAEDASFQRFRPLPLTCPECHRPEEARR